MNTSFKNSGYRIWKKQLHALKAGDFTTVIKLARQARELLEVKRTGKLRLLSIN